MEEIMTAEKMFGKPIEECNPIERSILQDYIAKSDPYLKNRLKLKVLRALLEEAKRRHDDKINIIIE